MKDVVCYFLREEIMKFKFSLFVVLVGLIGSAHAGTYTCDVELDNGSKTKIRGVSADSASQAARIVKESRNDVKYINCFKAD